MNQLRFLLFFLVCAAALATDTPTVIRPTTVKQHGLPSISPPIEQGDVSSLRDRHPLDQGADLCPATVITSLPYRDAGWTSGLTNDYELPGCLAGTLGGPDVVYSFVAQRSGLHSVTSEGSYYDVVLNLRTGGDCPGATGISCGSDVAGNLTAGQTYYIVVDNLDSVSGYYTLSVYETASVNFQPGDIVECAEVVDSSHARLDCNGGCNNSTYGGVNSFTTIADGQTISGRGFTFVRGGSNFRDTDWYQITLAHSAFISLELYSSFQTSVVGRSGLCPGATQFSGATAPYVPETIRSGLLSAGTYYIVVTPALFSDIPQPLPYRFKVSVEPNCLTGFPMSECAQTGGIEHLYADCNGGDCNAIFGGTPSFSRILPGQSSNLVYRESLFGYSALGSDRRDTDWYRFTLSEPCTVRFDILSNIAATAEIGNFPGSCQTLPFTTPVNVCQANVFQIPCLPAGEYVFKISPNAAGVFVSPKQYQFNFNFSPCSGCRFDTTATAPFPSNFYYNTTCGAGDDCTIDPPESFPSADRIARVNVPEDGEWTFSLCQSPNAADAYMHLMSRCCDPSSVIAQGGDGCTNGLPEIRCVSLSAGTYYVLIGGNPDQANVCLTSYLLTVSQCLGRCCYGPANNPQCTVNSHAQCLTLGGQWTSTDTICSGSPCLTRPGCPPTSIESQPPMIPNEAWAAFANDQEIYGNVFEEFTDVVIPTQGIRFWGIGADANAGNAPCIENPQTFDIRFYQNNNSRPGTLAQSYSMTLTGTPSYLFDGMYTLYEWDAVLSPPLQLINGWVSIVGMNNPACSFFWMSSPSGNDQHYYRAALPGMSVPEDLSVCLISPQDTCGIVIPSLPYSTTGNTLNNVNDATGCAASGTRDAIYRYTSFGCENVTVSLCGSAFDTGLEIRSGGSCPGDNFVLCNDDGICTPQSQATFSPTAGVPYYFIVHGGEPNAAGAYSLNVTSVPVPVPSDTCGGHLITTNSATLNGSFDNCLLGNEINLSCNGTGHKDAIFTYAPVSECEVLANVSVCGTGTDFVLQVRTGGACPGDSVVACVTNACQSFFFTAEVIFDYFLIVERAGADTGSFTLTITGTEPRPAGDSCLTPRIIPSLPFLDYGSTRCATHTPLMQCGALNDGPDVYYQYTAAVCETLTVSLCGSSYDTQLIAHRGTCTGASNVLCNNNFCGLQSQIQFVATAANIYTFVVESDNVAGPDGGPYILTVTSSPCVAPLGNVDSLVIRRVSNDIALFWSATSGAVSYNIYRGDTPDVSAIPGNLIGTSSTLSYVDLNVVSGAALKFFYTVTASNTPVGLVEGGAAE